MKSSFIIQLDIAFIKINISKIIITIFFIFKIVIIIEIIVIILYCYYYQNHYYQNYYFFKIFVIQISLLLLKLLVLRLSLLTELFFFKLLLSSKILLLKLSFLKLLLLKLLSLSKLLLPKLLLISQSFPSEWLFSSIYHFLPSLPPSILCSESPRRSLALSPPLSTARQLLFTPCTHKDLSLLFRGPSRRKLRPQPPLSSPLRVLQSLGLFLIPSWEFYSDLMKNRPALFAIFPFLTRLSSFHSCT